ncbi:MAG: DUF72 domain-containing protein [Gemmatimonadetes bacterium]|nr:DUF72 domain-containing protein [Gemmatimonadota bacterium]
MTYYVGTSGYAFKEWKGTFYPAKLPDAEMLPWYASKFNAVEINNTFYRMPREKNLLDWAAAVPDRFRFAIKATQRITHHAQLRDAGDLVGYLAQTVAVMGPKLGSTLFQLPPFLKKDLPRLADFLETLPKRWRVTIEFRHPSWFDDDQVLEALKAKDVALCISDQDELAAPVIATASWGYLRLHRFDYQDSTIGAWSERIKSLPFSDAFVFFKHDHSPGSGPPVAEKLWSVLAR